MRRRRSRLGAIEDSVTSSILSKGFSGAATAAGFLMPGFGIVIGFLLKKLFEDKPNAWSIAQLQRLQEIGKLVKARDYKTADELWGLDWMGGFVQGQQPGLEKMFFISRIGNAIENGTRARALAMAQQIDAWQNQWNAWKANVDGDIARALSDQSRLAPAVAIAEQGGTAARLEFSDERGDYVLMRDTDEGAREIRQHSD